MNAPALQHRSSAGWTRSEVLLIGGSLLSMLAILTIVASLLARERADAMLSASRSAFNIISLIEADVQRTAQLYDASLLGMIRAWRRPDIMALPTDLRRLVMFDRASTAPYMGDLVLLDKHGAVLAEALPGAPRQDNFADRNFFRYHQDSNTQELYVSRPFKARWGFKDWSISFSRRLSAADGEFLGVASAAMRLAYFRPLFRSQSLGADSSISLINTDATLLVREPDKDERDQTGTDLSGDANYQRILEHPEGSFIGYAAEHGHNHVYSFCRVKGLPLIVVITQPESGVYAAWRRNALLVGGATGILCLGWLWLTLQLIRELRLRQRAENELAGQAATDGLTGLPNRRQLEKVLASEWARAQRSGDLLAVLMVDVDHFRRFNERHGHLGGDQALRLVAKCIADSIHRHTDFAARYGGEEFLVLLPATDRQGALNLAENIRRAVMALPPFEPGQQALTVSIGVSSAQVRPLDNSASLIDTADKALYEAKHKGRNRVEFMAFNTQRTADT